MKHIPDISPGKLQVLLGMVCRTHEIELTCDESGDHIHRYIEFRISGTGELPADLKLVEEHLFICGDCREVVESTIEALKHA